MEIKALRKSLGLTQIKMAQQMGISVFTIRRWEKGIGKPPKMAVRLMEELKWIGKTEGTDGN